MRGFGELFSRKQTNLVLRPRGAIREAGTGLCFGKDQKRHRSAVCCPGRKACVTMKRDLEIAKVGAKSVMRSLKLVLR